MNRSVTEGMTRRRIAGSTIHVLLGASEAFATSEGNVVVADASRPLADTENACLSLYYRLVGALNEQLDSC